MKSLWMSFTFYILSTLSLSAQELQNQSDTLSKQATANIYTEQTLLIIIFTLVVLVFIALVIFFLRIKNLKKEHTKMIEMQELIKQRHDKLLSDMSRHIQNMAQEAVRSTHELADKIDNSDFRKIVSSENKLLGITNDLIEFLRLKSKKVEIISENYKLLNLLNDTSGILSSNYRGQDIELNYDIDNNIPNVLIGDTLNLNKILVNVLEYCINNKSNELTLKIYKTTKFNTEPKLNFSIKTDTKIDIKDSVTLFESVYDETTSKYEDLDLFVAKELSLLMQGDLVANKQNDNSVEFLLTIPFNSVKETSFKLEEKLENKKVLIIESNYNSALAIQKVFLNFKYKVDVESKANYLLNKPDFSIYDIIVLDKKLFNKTAIGAIKESKAKVISVGTIFNFLQANANKSISNIDLSKPITRESALDALRNLYSPVSNIVEANIEDKESSIEPLKIHREIFANTPDVTLQRFSEFKGSNLLLVEDNYINQKVLTSVLNKSGIIITIANNGQEAIDFIKSDKKFDLVLMDINMPTMDGYTATSIIREETIYNSLPIVSLTALTTTDEVAKMFACGMNGFLAKPFYKEKLFTVFNVFIANKPVFSRFPLSRNSKAKEFEGLNINVGIANTDNNSMFYKEVLYEFKDAYRDTANTFKTLIEDFRFEQLRIFCLDLKGLSGAIGASQMHNLTTEILQLLIFKRHELLTGYIIKYTDELDKLNRAIDKYLAL
ncbi:MAG: hypothetical protein AUK54_00500 [Helicobacteraceae bacterium CG2_30_36_10]|nr:MAG: hypothetical protein AUK54_00500 [Helicobacteraceae bacterium CG2_30_36_10]